MQSIQQSHRAVILRLWPLVGLLTYFASTSAHAEDGDTGFSPFVSAQRTHDSNLLNRSTSGGPAPESDRVDRVEVGAHVDFQLSRQRFSGLMSVSETRHQRFSERNTEGDRHRLRWDAEIGNTVVGSVEVGTISDQAPIQTGQVDAIRRDQDLAAAKLEWRLHPNYALLAEFAETQTEFQGASNTSGAALAGLNRTDETRSVGVAYQPTTGSSVALLFKRASGSFPIRQIIAPGQTVSNNFEQQETELLTRWNYSELVKFTWSLSSVDRQHAEIQSRDFSGTNYRVEISYQPTVSTNVSVVWAEQIIGISDVSNSDALSKQVGVSMRMDLTSKVRLQLSYLPQTLEFNGTDGLNAALRTERLKDAVASLSYQVSSKTTLGAVYRKRERETTIVNGDYAANSTNVFLKYEF